jgi:hypothetical protein
MATAALKKQSTINAENEYTSSFWLHVRDDPSLVRFPLYNDSGIATQDLSEISKIQELSMGVHTVRVEENENVYVYKEIGRPMYGPRDSEVLEKELRNLNLVIVGVVVQLVAPVVSSNPYQTTKTTYNPIVLQGILLEYHPNGTLQDALRSPKECLPWRHTARCVKIT